MTEIQQIKQPLKHDHPFDLFQGSSFPNAISWGHLQTNDTATQQIHNQIMHVWPVQGQSNLTLPFHYTEGKGGQSGIPRGIFSTLRRRKEGEKSVNSKITKRSLSQPPCR